MVKWLGGVSRNYIYMPNMGHIASRFREELIKVFRERGDIVRAIPANITKGFIRKRSRPTISVAGLGISATVTAMEVGPDLYIGYVISTPKKELDDLEFQDLEAFSSYLVHTIEETLRKLEVL